MVVITGLEFRFGASNVMFGGAIRCDRGFVNDSCFENYAKTGLNLFVFDKKLHMHNISEKN